MAALEWDLSGTISLVLYVIEEQQQREPSDTFDVEVDKE